MTEVSDQFIPDPLDTVIPLLVHCILPGQGWTPFSQRGSCLQGGCGFVVAPDTTVRVAIFLTLYSDDWTCKVIDVEAVSLEAAMEKTIRGL